VLQPHMSQQGTSIVIIHDDNDMVGIKNATVAHLSAHDVLVV
jgi:hypothetical protein